MKQEAYDITCLTLLLNISEKKLAQFNGKTLKMGKIEIIIFITLIGFVEKSFSRRDEFNQHHEAIKIGEWILYVSEFRAQQLFFYFWNVLSPTRILTFFVSFITMCLVHLSFTGGLFDGTLEESEMVFKYAAMDLNSHRNKSSAQIKTSELVLLFALCLHKHLFKTFSIKENYVRKWVCCSSNNL